ncbi:MAG TPA: Na+/H+ antiporter subunit E [Pseudonocardiaceae bacterium]|nr:Na+/H+ antiporter subunit E [Pseudonocardiaceae bacterium]
MLARIGEIAAWWAVLLLVWLASLNAFSYAELATAAGLALPCAFAARAGRIAASGRWRVKARWARWLLFAPAAILHDTVAVLRLATRPDRPQDDSFDHLPAQDEALATAMVSAAPGSVVVDAERNRLTVHRLPIGETKLTEAVHR